MRFKSFRWAAGVLALAGIAALWQAAAAQAATVTLTAKDPNGTTSFNASGKWSNSEAPSAVNDYVISSGRYMRTPSETSTDRTFLGNSLTLGDGASTGMITSAGDGTYTTTINNLTVNNGSSFWQNRGSSTMSLAGTGMTLTSGTVNFCLGNGTSLTTTTIFRVLSDLSGAAKLNLTTPPDVPFVAGLGYISLEGNNSYTGGTRIAGVSVLVNSAASLPNYGVDGAVAVESGSATGMNGSLWVKAGGASDWTAAEIQTLLSNATFSTTTDPTILPSFGIDTSNATGAFTYSNDITDARGAISFTKRGAGTLILSGVGHTYTGATTVSAGTLNLSGTGDAANGIFSSSTARTFTVNTGAVLQATGEYSLGTANKFVLNGTGKIDTAQADSHLYINDLTTTGGKIQGTGFRVGKDSDAVFATTGTVNSGAATDITANVYMEKTASAGQFILDVGDIKDGYDMLITGDIADLSPETAGMSLVKRGAGALILRDVAYPINGGLGIKTFTGKTIVEAGWLRLGTSGFNGMLTGDLEVQSGAEVLIATGDKDSSPRTVNYGGNITGTGGIIQEYCGTGIYSGNHNYSGDTYIDGMYINNGSFTFDVNNGGDSSKFMQFTGGTVESTYFTNGGTASFDGVLNLDVSDLTETTGSWTLVDSALVGLYNMTGMNLVEGGLTIASFTGSGGDWSCTNGAEMWSFSGSAAGGVLNLSTVPEPSTLAMLSAALLGLIAYAWRRRK